MSTPKTIAATLTPHGRGAVAVMAVRGPQAEACIQHSFHAANGKAIESQPFGRILYGRWGGTKGEEVLLVRQQPGRVELHCHGGEAAPRAILTALHHAGCQITDAWEMLSQDADHAIQCEAARALADATTERTAAILLDQYRGALTQAFAGIEAALAVGDELRQAHARIDRLLALAEVGTHLTRPWRVVIAGQPNVGKSSLINALAGYERAIVFDTPGTTRDAVAVQTAIDGWPVELTDTAGMRRTADPLEQQAIERALSRVTEAELVVLVFDLSQAWTDEDERLLQSFPLAIVVHNKQDIVAEGEPRPPGLHVSARTGTGMAALVQEIGRRLVPNPPQPGEAVPFTDGQIVRLNSLQSRSDASS